MTMNFDLNASSGLATMSTTPPPRRPVDGIGVGSPSVPSVPSVPVIPAFDTSGITFRVNPACNNFGIGYQSFPPFVEIKNQSSLDLICLYVNLTPVVPDPNLVFVNRSAAMASRYVSPFFINGFYDDAGSVNTSFGIDVIPRGNVWRGMFYPGMTTLNFSTVSGNVVLDRVLFYAFNRADFMLAAPGPSNRTQDQQMLRVIDMRPNVVMPYNFYSEDTSSGD